MIKKQNSRPATVYWQSVCGISADHLFPQVKGSRSRDNNIQCDFSAIIFSHVNPHRAESEKSMLPAEKHELSSVWGDYILLVRGEGAEGRKSQVGMTMCNAPWLIDCSTLNGRSWMDRKTENVKEQGLEVGQGCHCVLHRAGEAEGAIPPHCPTLDFQILLFARWH